MFFFWVPRIERPTFQLKSWSKTSWLLKLCVKTKSLSQFSPCTLNNVCECVWERESEREGQAVCMWVKERNVCVLERERERGSTHSAAQRRNKKVIIFTTVICLVLCQNTPSREEKSFLGSANLTFFARSGQSVPPPASLLLASFLNGRSELFNISVGLS